MVIDSRETARIWIRDNLPHTSKIAIESYSLFINPAQFSVESFHKLIDHDPNWYVEQGFDYLIFSEGMYGRYYQDPEQYSHQIGAYNALFGHFRLVKLFNDGNYGVQIYQLPR